MLLHIDDKMTVGDLQDKFNECFPNPRLELYDMRHSWGKSSYKDHPLNSNQKLGGIRKNHQSGIYEIKSWYKTGRIEQDLRHSYGLFAQVYFMQNNEWVQSVASDDLSLAQLNERGDVRPVMYDYGEDENG